MTILIDINIYIVSRITKEESNNSVVNLMSVPNQQTYLLRGLQKKSESNI